MLSDLENLDIMLGGNHLEEEESEYSNSIRRPENPSYTASENNNASENISSNSADYG